MLSLVADHDPLYQSEAGLLGCASGDDEENTGHSEIQRPPTADRDDQDGRGDMPYSEQRPFTSARLVPNPQLQPGHSVAHEETSPPTTMTEKGGLLYSSDEVASSTSGVCPSAGSIVQICLVESWGDPDYTGLTGFQLLKAPSGEPVELREDQLTGVGEGFETLVGGVNLTTEEENMCLFPLDPLSAPPTITVTLATPTPLFGMRIWNYNASLEESYKGVRLTF